MQLPKASYFFTTWAPYPTTFRHPRRPYSQLSKLTYNDNKVQNDLFTASRLQCGYHRSSNQFEIRKRDHESAGHRQTALQAERSCAKRRGSGVAASQDILEPRRGKTRPLEGLQHQSKFPHLAMKGRSQSSVNTAVTESATGNEAFCRHADLGTTISTMVDGSRITQTSRRS